MGVEVPAWCRWRAGRGPALIVAPHGGARRATRPRGPADKVNDLHTAEVAAELAAALDASLVVNATIDRNDLDLNRLSQVCARAPWFLDLLEHLLDGVIARHGCAEVLIVHGWNTTDAKCDLGVGRHLADVEAAAAHPDALTVSPRYAATRLAVLRDACAAAGIAAPLGERYPARHPNNVLQLFRRGAPHPAASPRLAAWAAAGCVEAVQLELSVPLRWPGRMRQAFIAALIATAPGGRPPMIARSGEPLPPHATGAHRGAPSSRGRGAPSFVAAAERPRVGGVQVYDPAAGLGLSARVDVGRDGAVASRVLLFRGDREVALFTGETSRGAPLAGGPRFLPDADGFRLCFEGYLLVTGDGRLYVDLESAFAASRLLALRVDLRFAPLDEDYGRVTGALAIDGQPHALDAFGFARPAAAPGASGDGWQTQLSLQAAFAAAHALRLRHAVPGTTTLRQIGGPAAGPRAVSRLAVTFDADPHTPCRIAVGDDLLAEAITRMAIRRPLGGGRTARVTFGVARVTDAGVAGFGFYEYARAL